MKCIDINKAFTSVIADYLNRGYYFNAATMNGSQGEISFADMTNGVEIVRVLLQNFSESWDKHGVELVVGRVPETERVLPNLDWDRATIWNERLEQISVQRFYEVSGYGDSQKFYSTEADAEAVSKVRMRRYSQRPSRQNKDMTNAETIKIAIPFIRRKFRVRNVDKKRIEVFRTPDNRYVISYRGTGYQLNKKKN